MAIYNFGSLVALTIVMECSFFSWERRKCSNPNYIISAIDYYKESTNRQVVGKAIAEAFEEEKTRPLKEVANRDSGHLALTKRLVQISLENRLRE